MKEKVKIEKKPRKLKIIIISGIVVLLAVIAGGAVAFDYYLSSHTSHIFANNQGISFHSIDQAAQTPLKGEDVGRTNFMIYGLTLDEERTDTMILASYYWNEHKLVMLNIPRDIFAHYKGYSDKIVSLYAIGKKYSKGDRSFPAQFVSDFISQEYQIPIDYWVVGNMEAFRQLVDSLGGITVDVTQSFTDYLYPNDDYTGYIRPAPHFNAGVQTMDGTTALIYARSRHSIGSEGSDFARSRRQQIIIQAILDKLKAQGVFEDISKIDNYLNIFSQNIFTNMTPEEAIRLAKVVDQLNLSQDYLMTNWSNTLGFLCDSSQQDVGYILLYGTLGDCKVAAGINSPSPYRQDAINYVQNLLSYAEQEKMQQEASQTQQSQQIMMTAGSAQTQQ